jgi:exodeoxyribonuclease V beta subunit
MIPSFDPAATPLERGTTLIEASAGTGKTYTITALFLRLLLEEELGVSEILVTTYTEAATSELRDRIRLRLSGALRDFQEGASEDPLIASLLPGHDQAGACEKLERALREFDQAAIHTIHGFCQRMLRDRALESGMLFDTELVTDQRPILQELVEDFWRTHFACASPILGALALGSGVSPTNLMALLNAVIPRPLLTVIPQVPTDEFVQIRAEVEALQKRLCQTWAREGAKVRAAVTGPPKWAKANTRLGKAHMLDAWFSTLDRCLGGTGQIPSDYNVLASLCRSELDKACLKGASAPSHPFFELCDEYQRLLGGFRLASDAFFVAWSREELQRRKREQNILGFDDLLTRLHSALCGERGDNLATSLRTRFRAALIDEFQDTDAIQEDIFRKIFGRGDGWLYLIGDPKQAIYGFRGADIFTYLAASGAADRQYTLRTNRRSAAKLVAGVNQLFGQQPGAFVFDGINFEPVAASGDRDETPFLTAGNAEPPLKIWAWNDPTPVRVGDANRELPAATASAIAHLLGSGAKIGDTPLHPSQIAVLVAQHRQARAVQNALLAYQVPSVLLSDESVWKTHDACELHTVMIAVAGAAREPLVRAALATEILGANVSRLAALQQDETAWEAVLLRFTEYHQRWLSSGFIQMFRSFLHGEGIRARLLALPDGDRRLTNLMHLAELLHRAAIEQSLAPSALLRWLEAQRTSETPARDDESVLRLERDDDAVGIVTMHRSKGLEYEVVFCPYAWGRTEKKRNGELLVFHDRENNDRLTLDLGCDERGEHRAVQACEQLAEEARLLYVALTRAMYQCHFIWGRFRDCEISAAAWLMHRPVQSLPDCASALRSHMRALSHQQFESDLADLQSSASDAIEVRPFEVVAAPKYSTSASYAAAVAPRRFRGWINREWSLASFSSLVANRSSERPDYDDSSTSEPFASDESLPSGIHAMPGGRRTGVCLHRILERLDFGDESAIESQVARTLESFSFDTLQWTASVTSCVRRALAVQTGFGFALKEVSPAVKLTELEFHLPANRLEAGSLKKLLGNALEPLSFRPMRGWLKGFIDLVFEQDGRFYIVDWKSSRLGTGLAAYAPAAIAAEMARHHYNLQLHLYTIALHRYLALRLPGYDYEQHFGGCLYYFLRGIDTANPDYGIHRSRPDAATVTRLSEWLDGDR